MNSEELEVSLRTEFESYLKNVFAEMRQDISQLQERIETELENHRTQLDGVFKEALSRAEKEPMFDAGFTESVVEHLRQAKDEGARITATAIAEAEEMEKQASEEAAAAAVPKVGIKELHEAVNDISAKQSQAEILKTLVQHAGQFTPRGAFFIVKNDHFVGWRTFGEEKGESDAVVRDIFVPATSDTVLSESYRSLVTVESSAGTFSEDAGILQKLGFEGSPDKMYAVPLVVRGRAVAVLYADYGNEGAEVSVEALETMVRVAALTVEVLASAKSASTRESRKKSSKPFIEESFAPVEPKETAQPEFAATPGYAAPIVEPSYKSSFEGEGFATQQAFQEESAPTEYKAFDNYQVEPVQEETPVYPPTAYQQEEVPATVIEEKYPAYEDSAWNEPSAETVREVSSDSYSAEINADDYAQDLSYQPPVETSYQPTIEPDAPVSDDFSANPVNEYQFDNGQQIDNSPSFESPRVENFESFATPQASEIYAPAERESINPVEMEKPQAETSFTQPIETTSPPVQSVTPPVRSRFSERNVDLPIEVSEDERRLHNDARRFARLLVSEIKLYNEQKVKEGREAGDLYDRLREAVDRSREMYDKRVQQPVAAKFDYFHYEIVNTLAEGDETRLGRDYPGATV